ncbi:MAG: hypothetical protein J5861_04455 [Desulfovibrio sp.]|nr:hypothetical protein [Desulfovibrio sp.]
MAELGSVAESAEQGFNEAAVNTSLPGAEASGTGAMSEATQISPAGGGEAALQPLSSTGKVTGQTPGSPESKEQKGPAEAEPEKADKADPDKPITDWSKVKIDLPEGAPVDNQVLGDFGKKAVELGLTENQAKALVDFQLDAVARQRERLMEVGGRQLAEAWGGRVAENQQAVLTLIANIDRRMGEGNRFSKALNMCGATCLPDVCQGLLYLAQGVSEDSMGRGGAVGPADRKETAEEALMAEYRKVRGNRL